MKRDCFAPGCRTPCLIRRAIRESRRGSAGVRGVMATRLSELIW